MTITYRGTFENPNPYGLIPSYQSPVHQSSNYFSHAKNPELISPFIPMRAHPEYGAGAVLCT